MTALAALQAFLSGLESHGIPYMLVGALSVNQYAAPRSTDDADIVVDATPQQLAEVAAALNTLVVMDRQLTFETATGTKRTIFKVVGSHYRIETFYISSDPHDRCRFDRRVPGRMGGIQVWVPTAEDVIVWKLRWATAGHRAKDEEDVRNILATQGPALNFNEIRAWCNTHATLELLDRLLASLPNQLE